MPDKLLNSQYWSCLVKSRLAPEGRLRWRTALKMAKIWKLNFNPKTFLKCSTACHSPKFITWKFFEETRPVFKSYAFSKPAVAECFFRLNWMGLDDPLSNITVAAARTMKNIGVVGRWQSMRRIRECSHRRTKFFKPFWGTRHCWRSAKLLCVARDRTERWAWNLLWWICPLPLFSAFLIFFLFQFGTKNLEQKKNRKQSFVRLLWPWCALLSIVCTSEMGKLDNHGITVSRPSWQFWRRWCSGRKNPFASCCQNFGGDSVKYVHLSTDQEQDVTGEGSSQCVNTATNDVLRERNHN